MKQSTTNRPQPLREEGGPASAPLPSPLLNRRFTSTGDYRTLNPAIEEIRLIRLLPGSATSICRCELFTVRLKDRPSYRALSYAWGDLQDTCAIMLHDQPFHITANLEKALRQLRRVSAPIILWADAICINQTSDEERNHQVRLMRSIYQHAKEVVVWLGEERELYHDHPWVQYYRPIILTGVESDKQMIETYKSGLKRRGVYNDVLLNAILLLWFLAEGRHFGDNPFFTVDAVATLNEILHLPWWTRIWVVQETVVAPRATVLLGSVALSWYVFAKAARNYELHRSSCCPLFNMVYLRKQVEGQFETSITPIVHTRDILDIEQARAVWIRRSRTTLLPLVWQFRARQSTDPRDKVYALLGLVTRWGVCPPFEPDYSKNWGTVYRDITLHMISTFQSLDVLIAVSPSCITSWIPDWTRDSIEKNPDRLHQLENYDASKEVAAQVEVHGDILAAAAISLGSVLEISHELPVAETSRTTAFQWYEPSIRDWFLPRNVIPKEENVDDAPTSTALSWRLLCGDSITEKSGKKNARRAKDEDQELFDSWWLSVKALARTANSSQYGFNDDLGRFDHAVRTATTGRRFFRTSERHYGIGPPKMELGDDVWVLLGSRTPYVTRKLSSSVPLEECKKHCLRMEGSQFVEIKQDHKLEALGFRSLVGDCYLHGFMDGEALEKPEENRHTLYLV